MRRRGSGSGELPFLVLMGEKGREDYAERAIYIREKKERMAKMTLEEGYFLGEGMNHLLFHPWHRRC